MSTLELAKSKKVGMNERVSELGGCGHPAHEGGTSTAVILYRSSSPSHSSYKGRKTRSTTRVERCGVVLESTGSTEKRGRRCADGGIMGMGAGELYGFVTL